MIPDPMSECSVLLILAHLRESIAASDPTAAASHLSALALVDPMLARALLVGLLKIVADSFEDELDEDGS